MNNLNIISSSSIICLEWCTVLYNSISVTFTELFVLKIYILLLQVLLKEIQMDKLYWIYNQLRV